MKQKVETYLNNIKEKNPEINAIIETWEEEALKQAENPKAKFVVTLKDNIAYKNHKLTASSKILENFESIYSATVVERLQEAGAIFIGRTNCDEFAMGSSNENSYYGPVRNPLNTRLVAGGSSGGSAASVAADFCDVSLGSDTGGSIRQPAAFCGVVGFKPSYGRVSRYGLIAFASSLDQIGPIGKNVEDVAEIYEIIAGKDPKDSTSVNKPVVSYKEIPENQKYKIAVFQNMIDHKGLNEEIRQNFLDFVERLKSIGHQITFLEFPLFEYLVPTYYIISTAEASSNLARYDGIRYGFRAEGKTLEEIYVNTRSQGFGKEVKRRIILGTFVLSAGYYDAYYGKAQKVRRLIKNEIDKLFSQYDFLILPTTPTYPFELGSIQEPVEMYLNDVYTVLANLTGAPAIALPKPSNNNELPWSLQIIAHNFKDAELLRFAKDIEKL